MMPQDKFIPCIGVASLSSPLEVGADRAPTACHNAANLLKSFGYEVYEAGSIDSPQKAMVAGRTLAEKHVNGIMLASASWFEDYLVLDMLEECKVPLLIWSLPGMETGALCGSQQLTAILKQLGHCYDCVYGSLEDENLQKKVKPYLQATALYKKLRTARIGLAGHRVSGMTEASANEFMLKKAIGPRIVPIAMPRLLRAADAIKDDAVQEQWKRLSNRSGCCRVEEHSGLRSIKMYQALKEVIAAEGLDAIAFGCYPDWMGVACIASSLLADEGVPVGCEGDVNGAVGQLILTLLTGHPTHNTDWLEPLHDNTIVFSHCGSGSFELAADKQEIVLSPVRLANTGVCALFPAKPGIVTLLNLMPHSNGYQIALLTGEAVPATMVFPGNPLRVRFPHPIGRIIDWIHEKGIGHHWMAGYGEVSDQLRYWANMAGQAVDLIEL